MIQLRFLRSLSFRQKLILVMSAIGIMISVQIAIFIPAKLKSQSFYARINEVENLAHVVSYSIAPALFFEDNSAINDVIQNIRRSRDFVYIQIFDKAGRELGALSLEPNKTAPDLPVGRNSLLSEKDGLLHFSTPILLDGREIGRLSLGFSVRNLQVKITQMRNAIFLISSLFLGLGIIAVVGFSYLITRPLRQLSETAERIAGGDFSSRSLIASRDEVGQLSRSFNTMVDRLEITRRDIEELNQSLEKRVQERTRDLQKEINERKLVEKDLMIEKERAEAASMAKSEFLANMSHELRTPLNAVIGFSQVLSGEYFGKMNPKQIEYANDIATSGAHLLGLINDILDIAKIEAGKSELDLSPVDIRELLEHSFIMIKEKCTIHRITMELRLGGLPNGLTITADGRRLKQVLYNLLSNAAKFTPAKGRIVVGAILTADMLVISVEDTGIGIDPIHHDRIFEEFFQVQGGIRDKTAGTGLGLSLTRRIVDMHGGRIWVESEGIGQGTRVVFTLPVKRTSP
jgi:signal transduction histidine kinase